MQSKKPDTLIYQHHGIAVCFDSESHRSLDQEDVVTTNAEYQRAFDLRNSLNLFYLCCAT